MGNKIISAITSEAAKRLAKEIGRRTVVIMISSLVVETLDKGFTKGKSMYRSHREAAEAAATSAAVADVVNTESPVAVQ